MTSQAMIRNLSANEAESDVVLLELLRHGDTRAFEQLFQRHYIPVYRVLYHLFGQREEAEDIAQETFLTLYHHPPSGSGIQLLGWLCRVALNRGYNTLRSQRRADRHALQLGNLTAHIDVPDPASELLRAEERAHVRTTLAAMPERQGRMLLLRYAGLSYAEIAAALEIAPGSVGTLLVRAERAFLEVYRQRFGTVPEESTP